MRSLDGWVASCSWLRSELDWIGARWTGPQSSTFPSCTTLQAYVKREISSSWICELYPNKSIAKLSSHINRMSQFVFLWQHELSSIYSTCRLPVLDSPWASVRCTMNLRRVWIYDSSLVLGGTQKLALDNISKIKSSHRTRLCCISFYYPH